MTRFLKWLETKFSQHSSISGDTTVVQPKLSVRYKSSLDATESTGFDPYNSGSFESRNHVRVNKPLRGEKAAN